MAMALLSKPKFKEETLPETVTSSSTKSKRKGKGKKHIIYKCRLYLAKEINKSFSN